MPEFKCLNTAFYFNTKGEIEFIDLTRKAEEVVLESGVRNGVMHLFAPHATGIIVLTENDYGLLEDVRTMLERLIPRHNDYEHPSNAYAHLRSMLFSPDKTLPIVDGHLELGTWQSIMFIETDVSPRRRTIRIQVMGETL